MESVQKAQWFTESRFEGEVSLDELSQVAGISRYHFAHVDDQSVVEANIRTDPRNACSRAPSSA
jgi:hypothetical protein